MFGASYQRGVNVNAANCNALFMAMERSNERAVNMLIEAGANGDMTEQSGGRTALMLAIERNNTEWVNLLIQSDADVNNVDFDGDTALIYAAELGHSSCLNLIIQAGARVNKPNNNKETALMFALTGGHSQCLAALIQAGANVNTPMRTHKTALSYALEVKHEECLRVMIEAGADEHGSLLLHNLISKKRPSSLDEHEDNLKIKTLLRAGAVVNSTVDNLLTPCLDSNRKPRRKKELALLLFAAGEKFTKTLYYGAEYLRPPKRKALNHLCRKAIRKHLLEINNVNLFYKVPRLGLPPALSKYLLYEQSVNE